MPFEDFDITARCFYGRYQNKDRLMMEEHVSDDMPLLGLYLALMQQAD